MGLYGAVIHRQNGILRNVIGHRNALLIGDAVTNKEFLVRHTGNHRRSIVPEHLDRHFNGGGIAGRVCQKHLRQRISVFAHIRLRLIGNLHRAGIHNILHQLLRLRQNSGLSNRIHSLRLWRHRIHHHNFGCVNLFAHANKDLMGTGNLQVQLAQIGLKSQFLLRGLLQKNLRLHRGTSLQHPLTNQRIGASLINRGILVAIGVTGGL